jgi:hypothetical protein
MPRRLQRYQFDQRLGINWNAPLTVHNHFHIVHKTVDNLQDVRLHHAGLVLGEPVQSTHYIFDLTVPQQLLCELLCDEFRRLITYRHSQGTLTESPLLDLFLRLGKDGKHFDHYLYDYLRHQRAQRDLGIYFEAFEEASDAFEEFKESVIARADSFSRLI